MDHFKFVARRDWGYQKAIMEELFGKDYFDPIIDEVYVNSGIIGFRQDSTPILEEWLKRLEETPYITLDQPALAQTLVNHIRDVFIIRRNWNSKLTGGAWFSEGLDDNTNIIIHHDHNIKNNLKSEPLRHIYDHTVKMAAKHVRFIDKNYLKK